MSPSDFAPSLRSDFLRFVQLFQYIATQVKGCKGKTAERKEEVFKGIRARGALIESKTAPRLKA